MAIFLRGFYGEALDCRADPSDIDRLSAGGSGSVAGGFVYPEMFVDKAVIPRRFSPAWSREIFPGRRWS